MGKQIWQTTDFKKSVSAQIVSKGQAVTWIR